MKRILILVISLLMVMSWLLAACVPKAAPAPAPAPTAAPAPAPAAARAAPVPAAPAKPGWEMKWEEALAAAKHEGTIIINVSAGGDVRVALMKIAKMQGIQAEVITMRGSAIWPKVFAERRAGLYLWDIRLGGLYTAVTIAKPAGILQPLDSALILPHLTDPEVIRKVWYQGMLPWVDRDHTGINTDLQPALVMAINTTLVKPDELKSYRDLLDPKWEGKLVLDDPTISGSAQLSIQGLVNIMGEDYVRELAKARPIVMRDQHLEMDWLARGKVAIVMYPALDVFAEYLRAGAPIKAVQPKEGTALATGNAGAIAWFKDAPHPNASQMFINWYTSKEAQEILVKAAGTHSTREDVSTAHFSPELMRVQGMRYFNGATEEAYSQRPVTDKLAKDLFGPLIK